MRFYGIFLGLLVLTGSISTVYAHPDPLNATVRNHDGLILYQQEFNPPEKPDPAYIEPFTKTWVYHYFIEILTVVITVIMTVTVIIVYRDEIVPKVSKIKQRS